MEFGTGSGFPPTSGGGEGQLNVSRMQQPDRQQQGGSIYHQGQHQLSPGKFHQLYVIISQIKEIQAYILKS